MMTRYLSYVFIFSILWIIFRYWSYKRGGKVLNKGNELIFSLFFVYLLGVFFVTFEPFKFYFPSEIPLKAFIVPFEQISAQFGRNSSIAWYYLIANIVMLVPFGVLVPMIASLECRFLLVMFLGFCFSLAIETIQLLFTFRSFDVDDIIFNVTGALVGYSFYYLTRMLLRKKNMLVLQKYNTKNNQNSLY